VLSWRKRWAARALGDAAAVWHQTWAAAHTQCRLYEACTIVRLIVCRSLCC
jgi:hypothetical protein